MIHLGDASLISKKYAEHAQGGFIWGFALPPRRPQTTLLHSEWIVTCVLRGINPPTASITFKGARASLCVLWMWLGLFVQNSAAVATSVPPRATAPPHPFSDASTWVW